MTYTQNTEEQEEDKEFGVIAQIVSFKVTRDRVPFPSVRFICTALQRFVLVSQRTDHRSIYIGSVRILRDLVPRDPLCLLRPARKKCYLYSKWRLAPDGSLSKDYGIPLKYLESMWTSIPYTALHACSLEKAMDDLTQMAKRWFSPEEAYCIPTDPTKLSFWIASKILITDMEKVHLFVMKNVLERLQLEYRLVKGLTKICCRDCNADVGSVSDVFSMNKEGPMGIFVNSRGVAHEIVTLRNLRNVFGFGRPASEMTWFRGYQWTILLCSSCTTHLGWKFTAEEENLEPECFYACTRMAITASAESGPAERAN
ncbi:Protein cereblon [Trichuris trichiura]|uniref:Protein cereblon n=1 Tax=Trichuris trichiura TaxID=36087 RepID=A0A077ZAJ7_TRITR|nr:Protein cereblon [Trichuris trichiura]